MKNFLTNIKNNINNFLKINPHKHWNFLIYTFFSLVLALMLFSFYLLYEIRNDKIFQVTLTEDENQNLLKESLLETTLNTYKNKAAKIAEIKSGGTVYGDPSL